MEFKDKEEKKASRRSAASVIDSHIELYKKQGTPVSAIACPADQLKGLPVKDGKYKGVPISASGKDVTFSF